MKLGHTLLATLLLTTTALADTTAAPHVQVDYSGIERGYAQAIAQTLSAAWAVYADEFGFDMPATVVCTVSCAEGQPTRLFTDGKDRITLDVSTPDKLLQPRKSGTYNLYGMCHELGHMAMYRILKDRDWMSSAAAEGFAHYIGSVVVDRVYEAKGQNLWPDAYDYREDGSARLKRQLAAPSTDATAKAAGQWQKLEQILGRKAFARVFLAWQIAGIDATNPDEALLAGLLKQDADKKAIIEDWWKASAALLVEKRDRSSIAASQVALSKLTGKPTKIAQDDDSAEGKRSIAGGGHARTFQAPAPGEWYMTAVWVHGGRYGPVRAPATQFDIALCEPDLKPISTWKKPYAAFPRGDSKWIRFDVPPTKVPEKFTLCLNFRPTASNGIYVSIDDSTKGSSVVGTPGRPGRDLAEGDWMIRVEVDQVK